MYIQRRSGKVCDKSLSGRRVGGGWGVVINNDKSGDPRGDVIFGMRVRQLTARAAPSECE